MTVAIDIEIDYVVEGVPKGRINEQSIPIRETLPFAVDDRPGRALSIAISGPWQEPYVAIDGRLHRPANPDLSAYRRSRATPRSEVALREIRSSGREEAIAAMQSRMDRCVVVDGRVYMRTFGPALVVENRSGTGYASESWNVRGVESIEVPAAAVSIEGDVEGFLERISSLHYTNLEKARAAMAAIEVHIPGLCDPAGFDAMAAVRTARRVFAEALPDMRLNDLPSTFLRGWLAYGASPEPSPGECASALEMAADAGRSLREERVGKRLFLSDEEKVFRTLLEEADLAAFRYLSRNRAFPPTEPDNDPQIPTP